MSASKASQRVFGSRGSRALASLSNAELERELTTRRQKRGMIAPSAARDDLARHYASLELTPGATREQVEAAHTRLRAKYEPYTKSSDADRAAAAQHLVQALQSARDELLRAL